MPLKSDLEHILAHTTHIWPPLKNGRIFISGGTGFIGKWLLESLLFANENLNLNIKAVVLTRNPALFIQKFPHLANNSAISLHLGDVRNFQFPQGEFTHVIHGATDVSTTQTSLNTYDVIANGTKHVLNFSHERDIREILLISSGAVYGRQPSTISHIDEQYNGSPQITLTQTAYGQGKRTAEWFANVYNTEYGLKCRIARCFAFIGPYLPLTGPFAVGNFVANLLGGETIKIKGDGTPVRSYLYAADMAIWLWTILVLGNPSTAYNVGSDQEISIEQLASRLAFLTSPITDIKILAPTHSNALPERYVPSIKLAQENLGLQVNIPIDDALSRMVCWARNNV